jgi:hypothetical protein
LEALTQSGAAREADQRLVFELAERDRGLRGERVVGADGGDEWLVGDDLGLDSGGLGAGVTDQPEVDQAVLESGDDVVLAVFEQRDLDIRVLMVEVGEYARQVHGARRDRWDGGDGHAAA